MSDILSKITAYKLKEVADAKEREPMQVLAEYARSATPPRGFANALSEARAAGRIGLIAEVKRASPSKGLIRADFDPGQLAQAYAAGGATCLSVLTDGPSFQGDPAHLKLARQACELPVLRKDFMLDPYQVIQARAWGADAVLIIMAEVSDDEARSLMIAADDWGMDALVEVHDEAELDRALALPAQLIGINNRNLRTFETRLETTETLATKVGDERLVVSESGIATHADIQRLGKCGVTTFLVGESLMRQSDVTLATHQLLGTT
ncbi:MAG: indole-3-glycerol phosphate synthase TrpC [Pseudomonadota bacterium]